MKKNSTVILKMSPVGPFYSQYDEVAFFEWIDKLECVKKYEGQLRTLYIEVSLNVNEQELKELLSLFYRYKINMRQLSVFDQKKFARWFRNEDAYWYKRVFGKKGIQ